MATMLNSTIGSLSYDNLINSHNPPTDVFGVNLIAGQGVLARGTLLALSGNGMVIISAESSGNANCILAEDADTGGDGEGTPVIGIAYRAGHFNANALIVTEGYSITAEDKEALRIVGILLSDAVEL